MPLFRRRVSEPEPTVFTVGVDNHRVIVGSPQRGCLLLEELEGYVPAVASRAGSLPGGRDPVAVQSAKMDYAEMVEATISVLSLALEELLKEGLLDSADVPAKPQPRRLDRSIPTYDYIQATYTRATERIAWVRAVDRLLAERGIAVAAAERESSQRPR